MCKNVNEVLKWFSEICKIPHGSGNTKKISDFCVNFAKERNLQYIQDDMNNVIIMKAATIGYETAEPVILQGHLDMVCEKTAESSIDFIHDGLKLCENDDWIYAEGATLGGDDGIAIAMILAILDSDKIKHPKIEAVFTVDEEIGMLGAQAIDLSMIKGKRLINIDSENEGIFTVSCAGGNVTECILPVERACFSGSVFRLKVSGLIGGHSGIEIDKMRANSNILMARILINLSAKTEVLLISLSGGKKDNVIPNETEAVFVVENETLLQNTVAEFKQIFKNEYGTSDPDISVSVIAEKNIYSEAVNADDTKKIITLLSSLPNGIQEMSAEISGLVKTSLNMGIVNLRENELSVSYCIRSSVTSQKEMLKQRIKALVELMGGKVKFSGDYPAWEYKKESHLRKQMNEVFFEQYNKYPVFEAIHAGVECGLFCGKIKDLDCVSIGPDLKEIHTTNEKMRVSSVTRVWNYIIAVLEKMC